MTRIRKGNCFNEECVFYNKPSRYDIRVVSEHAKILKLSKDLVYTFFNDEVRTEIKTQFKHKI